MLSAAPISSRAPSPSRSSDATVPTSSTCPWTMCPPSGSPARSAGSRLTWSPGASRARVVRASVSGTAWKRIAPWSTVSAVRHTPATETESPTESPSAVRGASTWMLRPSSPPSTRATRPTSRTIPVNTRSRLPAGVACVDSTQALSRLAQPPREQDVDSDSLELGLAEVERFRQRARHRRAGARDDGRDEDEQPVDETVREECRRERRAALQEERLHPLPGERGELLPQRA